jgi:hypothetical protein
MARGGYRQPGNPAPVSGPGALSKRTDGGPGQPVRTPSGGKYGERQALEQMQQAAPVSASPGGDMGAPQPAQDVTAGLVGFDAPTQEPGTPVTAGAALGDGPGLEALGLPSQPDQDMRALVMWLPALERAANVPGAPKAFRNLVRSIKAYA